MFGLVCIHDDSEIKVLIGKNSLETCRKFSEILIGPVHQGLRIHYVYGMCISWGVSDIHISFAYTYCILVE